METEIKLKKGDITKLDVGAIVNAADNELSHGGGVSGAIHEAAGPELLEECETLGRCKTGQAKLTKGYEFPADYVIHTGGPVWRGGDNNEAEKLASCYKNSLKVAQENGIKNVAFPAVSTGIYGYPVEKAAKVSLGAVKDFIENDSDLEKIIFVLHSDEDFEVFKNIIKKIFKP